jgi:hypothetical protein
MTPEDAATGILSIMDLVQESCREKVLVLLRAEVCLCCGSKLEDCECWNS